MARRARAAISSGTVMRCSIRRSELNTFGSVVTFMKVTTLPKVLSSLQRLEHRITVPEDIASRARLAIERMVAIGGQTPLSPVPEASEDPGE